MEILIIFLLLLVNGLFAMAEIAIVSSRKVRLQRMADSGSEQSLIALQLASQPDQFLATVQVGITLVGILAGAFGGATIAEGISAWLSQFPSIAPYSETIAVAIVVILITYFTLVIGELVPKRLALNNPEAFASALAGPMMTLSKFARPIVRLLSASSNLIIRLLGVRPSVEPSITPEEINILIEEGTQSGVFEASEQDMIANVLRLDERRVEAFMTPRTQIVWFNIEETTEGIRRKIEFTQFSYYPVVRKDLEDVIGIARALDLLKQALAGQPLDLGRILQSPVFAMENMTALSVLELFQEKGPPIVLITDEQGGIQGMVTHNDLLDGIAGTLPSSHQVDEPTAIRREDGSWLVDGLLHIDELKELFEMEKLPGDESGDYQTVGGFVMAQMRRIPDAGQSFEWGSLRFEVVDMDGRRVDKVLVTPQHSTDHGKTGDE